MVLFNMESTGNAQLAPRGNPEDLHLCVVAPVYNEEKGIAAFVEEVLKTLSEVDFSGSYELLLINDGSRDRSGEILDGLAREHPGQVRVVHLSRNFGHESAVSAGLQHADADAVILMDSDMQDDPAAFHDFIREWLQGYEVVYAVRSSRRESFFMRTLFWAFYALLDKLSNFALPMNAGNYSLMDRRVVEHLAAINERNRYLPGLRAWIGFRQKGVEISRRGRYDQRPRVGLRAKWTLAMNAIFSFSYVPIFLFRAFGIISLLISFILFFIAFFRGLLGTSTFTGLLSPVIWISFFAGINLFGISIIGEYVARIYDELKARPKYIIDRITQNRTPGTDK